MRQKLNGGKRKWLLKKYLQFVFETLLPMHSFDTPFNCHAQNFSTVFSVLRLNNRKKCIAKQLKPISYLIVH